MRLLFVGLLIIALSPNYVAAQISASLKSAAKKAATNSASKQAIKTQSPQVIKNVSDKVIRRWTAHFCTQCPLPNKVGASFTGGSYNQIVLGKDTVFHRVYNNPDYKFGPKHINKNIKRTNKISEQLEEEEYESRFSYWSRTKSTGIKAIVDHAIPTNKNGNIADKIVSVRVPKGTTIYEGKAGSIDNRTTGGGRVVGGGSQVVLKDVRQDWEIVSH